MQQNRRKKKKSVGYRIRRFLYYSGQTVSEKFKQFMRSCYRFGFAKCAIIGTIGVLLIVLIILVCTIPKRTEEYRLEKEMAEMETRAENAAVREAIVQSRQDNRKETEAGPTATPELRYEKGSEGEDVQKIQERLMELGYLAIDEPTSYFGSVTKEAVKLFQRQHELDQDGIIGNDTYRFLMSEEAQKYVMKEGAEGNDIEDFQDKLMELGYLDSHQVTGYYGTDTVNAVTKFQKRNKLKQDGKAGEKTLETINSADARVSYTKEKEIEEEKKAAEKEAAKKTVSGRIDILISTAKSKLGKPYVLGARGPDSFDCSGFAYYCLRKASVYCRRLDAAGYSRNSAWDKIESLDKVQKGDLLFFSSEKSSSVGHVGIYIGNGKMIDASSGNGKVIQRSCRTPYWKKYFVCARRPIK